MKILMSQSEIDLFSAFLQQTSSYFEFGMGGSTCLAASLVKDRIHAIDSDKNWVDGVRAEIGSTQKDALMSVVNIGPTGNWGNPIGRDHENLFDDYSLSITRTGFSDYDLCLVDGRFRVACFLQALMTLRSDAVIAFHDYTSRPHYHVVEEFARPVAGIGQLKLFVRREGMRLEAVAEMIQKYRRNPA
ncbi:hypothetical protein [Sphingomonas sp. KC8]|uniref:hypothetical protein n=1 Tax=Sphingomonas sp. KC8 TaxID=1030157 RepID=UPI000A31CB20|nr:hypothetical protein [Sphingomonas sp. KC8]ARS28398.1 hypothetical protein KC8_14025 [Sphingomonas sp. KC8]